MLHFVAMVLGRLSVLAAVLALGGCCLTAVTGSTNGLATTSANGSSTGGSFSGTSSGTSTGGGTTGSATSGGGSTSGSGGSTTGGEACVLGPASDMTSQATYTSSGFSSLASADLNGDGLLDLVAGYVPPPTGYVPPTSNDFVVFLSQADGGLSPPVSYALSGSFGGAVAIGDLNGDGQPDVAVSYADFVGIFLNDGKGTLTEGAKLGARNGLVVGIAIGDINADGFVDLIATEFSSGLGLTSAEVFYGQGHGIFAAAVALPGVGGTLLGNPVIGDLNLDGLPDIAAASSGDYANLHLVVLLSQGDGGFQSTAYETPLLGQLILLPRAAGAPDLAIANPNVPLGDGGFPESPGTIRLLVNSGDGRFSIGPSYPVPGGEFLTLGDFNGDCIPDIATSACGATAFGSGLSVLYGDTDGGFEAPVSLQTPAEICPAGLAVLGAVESPRALASADLGAGGVTVYGNASRQ